MIKVVDLAAPTPALHRDVTVGSNCDGGGEGMEVSAAALVRLARATTIAPVRGGSEGSGREHRATFSDRSRRASIAGVEIAKKNCPGAVLAWERRHGPDGFPPCL